MNRSTYVPAIGVLIERRPEIAPAIGLVSVANRDAYWTNAAFRSRPLKRMTARVSAAAGVPLSRVRIRLGPGPEPGSFHRISIGVALVNRFVADESVSPGTCKVALAVAASGSSSKVTVNGVVDKPDSVLTLVPSQ